MIHNVLVRYANANGTLRSTIDAFHSIAEMISSLDGYIESDRIASKLSVFHCYGGIIGSKFTQVESIAPMDELD